VIIVVLLFGMTIIHVLLCGSVFANVQGIINNLQINPTFAALKFEFFYFQIGKAKQKKQAI